MRHLLAAIAMVSGLAGCVTYPDPVPIGNGEYSVESGPGEAAPGVEDEDYQRAIRFCFDQGKQLMRSTADADVPGPSGLAFGDLRFRCVGPGEPGWKEPVG